MCSPNNRKRLSAQATVCLAQTTGVVEHFEEAHCQRPSGVTADVLVLARMLRKPRGRFHLIFGLQPAISS